MNWQLELVELRRRRFCLGFDIQEKEKELRELRVQLGQIQDEIDQKAAPPSPKRPNY
jgi:hypothetical protein